MNTHVNIEFESSVPDYGFYSDTMICGFFGVFRFLSNFYPCPDGIWWKGTKFPSVENAYQAAKLPEKYHKEFVNITSGQSKKLSKKYKIYIIEREMWQINKYGVMSQLVFQKFVGNSTFQEMLVETNDMYLEERNNWGDTDWGTDIHGKGDNNLGKILMKTRDFLNK